MISTVQSISPEKSGIKYYFVGSVATTNRRLLNKTCYLEFEKPWSFLFFEEGDSEKFSKATAGGGRENFVNNQKCTKLSTLLNIVRTYFEDMQ